MTIVYILLPILALSFASVGYGMLVLFGRRFATLEVGLRFTAAYFLGQSLLAALFMFSALCGRFSAYIVLQAVVPGVVLAFFFCWRYRGGLRSVALRATETWIGASWTWRLMAVITGLLFAYGFSTIGRVLEGDASAFYLAASKYIVHSGKIGSLPGYETFSWVISTGEILYASLIALGMPGVSARFYEWTNFIPTLCAIYLVARLCALSVRAAFLSVVIVLTSSAAISLWSGGKTDTLAVGPALIGIWFALALWRSDYRAAFVAVSGLFLGAAVATKTSYFLVLLPSILLMAFWNEIVAASVAATRFDWKGGARQAVSLMVLSPLFFLGLLLGLAPFIIKNLVVFHAPFGPGAGQLASSVYFSKDTTLRLILSYPLALTYGRYWAQLGTLSPLILAFFPLWFMVPRKERQLQSPIAALVIATLVGLAIWMVLLPSVFMPRYMLASLLILSIPAAAGAAYASRQKSVLSATITLATAIAVLLTPFQVNSRSPIFQPERSIDYFRTGREDVLFVTDPYVSVTEAVNQAAEPNARTLLLVYSRVWLRGDLLASTSTEAEVQEAIDLLRKQDVRFWDYVEGRGFRFVIVDATLTKEFDAIVRSIPRGSRACEIRTYGGVTAFQLGQNCDACPTGDQMVLSAPFSKPWAEGLAFVASAPTLEALADSAVAPQLSSIVICEGALRLRRSHTRHGEIAAEGGGRYSHWGKEVYFSTSDNTDPNTNGRTYIVVKPRLPSPK